MWLKYKHKWREGSYGNYEYLDIGDASLQYIKDDIVSELENQYYNDSESYRGVDYEIIEYPPIEYLEKLEKELKQAIVNHSKRLDETSSLIAKLKLASENYKPK